MGIMLPKMKSEGYQNIITVVSCAMLTFCAYTWQSSYSSSIIAVGLICILLSAKLAVPFQQKAIWKDGSFWESMFLAFILAFVLFKREMLPFRVPNTGVTEMICWLLLGSVLTFALLPSIRMVNIFFQHPAPEKLQNIINSAIFDKICIFFIFCILITQAAFCCSTHIWLDEAFTLTFISPSYPEMMEMLAADVHPPLYYIIVKCSRELGSCIAPSASNIFIPKFVSLLPIIVMVVMGQTVIRKQWGRHIACSFSLAVVGLQPMIHYGTEMRMYSWAMLFVLITYISAYKLSQKRKFSYWALFLFSSVCAAYTHYFAIVAVVPAYLYLLYIARRKPLPWFICSTLAILIYSPWLPVFVSQVAKVRDNYWISPIHYETTLVFIKYTLPGISVFAGILFMGYAIQQAFEKHPKETSTRATSIFGLYSMLTPYFVIAIGCIASWLIRPVFVERYLLAAMGCFWLGLCILLQQKKRNYAACLLTIFIFLNTTVDTISFTLKEWGQHQKHLQFLEFSKRNKHSAFIDDDGHASATIKTMTGLDTYRWQQPPSKVFQIPSIDTPEEITQLSKNFETLIFVTSDADMEQMAAKTQLSFEYVGDFYIDRERKLYRIITPEHPEATTSPGDTTRTL